MTATKVTDEATGNIVDARDAAETAGLLYANDQVARHHAPPER